MALVFIISTKLIVRLVRCVCLVVCLFLRQSLRFLLSGLRLKMLGVDIHEFLAKGGPHDWH